MTKKNLDEYSVLFVDDELQVLKAIKRGLHLEKYNTFFASTGKEALEIIRNEEINVIVTDMKMPKMDGLQLLKKVHEMDRRIVKIILSGYTNLAQIIATINSIDLYKFILKPWDLKSELKPALIKAIEQYDSNEANAFNIDSAKKKNELFKKLVETNQQNYEQINNDFKSISRLLKMQINYAYFLSMQFKSGKMTNAALKDELNFIEETITGYINILPAIHKNLTIKELCEKLDTFLKRNYLNDFKEIYPNLKLTSDFDNRKELSINESMLVWFMKFILSSSFQIKYDSRIDLIIKEKEDEAENEKKKIIFLLKVDNFETIHNKTRENTVYILNSAFAGLVDGKYQVIKDKNGGKVVVIEI